MPRITFHPDVVKEVKSSYVWYQNQASGLGEDYLTELEASYQAIIYPSHFKMLVSVLS